MGVSEASTGRSSLTIVLAAGEGTRMRSKIPKVLHPIGGLSMLGHVLATAAGTDGGALAVVIGPDREDVAAEVLRLAPGAEVFVQRERRGTAHAVLTARTAIERGYDDVLVVFADTPLVKARTFAAMRAALAGGASVVVLGFEAPDPTGYGRLVVVDGALSAIREEKDASPHEKTIRFCNAGLMALSGAHALRILDAIGSGNAQTEFYLTDAVEIARAEGLWTLAVRADAKEVMGVNDRVQLAAAEAILQDRLRETAMRAGVTLIDPKSVFLSYDTVFARDVTVEPNVVFGPRVRIEEGAVIHAFSHLEGAIVRAGASVGPYGRLRPGADIGPKAKVGNFVEVKNAKVEAGAKISHLTYIGDARIGADANIGGGTITCNYDGYRKFHTDIGAGAFVGSNSSLVAPIKIGDGAYVGSGSVITDDVPADALAVGRGRQAVKLNWAKDFRNKRARDKLE